MEDRLQRQHRRRGTRRIVEGEARVVASAVDVPRDVQVDRAVLPHDLVTAGRLLCCDQRPIRPEHALDDRGRQVSQERSGTGPVAQEV